MLAAAISAHEVKQCCAQILQYLPDQAWLMFEGEAPFSCRSSPIIKKQQENSLLLTLFHDVQFVFYHVSNTF
jgi:hypothetical protein